MDVSTNLFSITSTKAVNTGDEIQPIVVEQSLSVPPAEENDNSDTLSINGQNVDMFGSEKTDEVYERLFAQAKATSKSKVAVSKSVKSLPDDETLVQNIKEQIYKFNNPTLKIGHAENDGEFKHAYNITDIDSCYEYLLSHRKQYYINVYEKLTVNVITRLAQNGTTEDENEDFWGCLNRAFANFPSDREITKADLRLFFMNASDYSSDKTSFEVSSTDFTREVEAYSNSVQKRYEKMSGQKKLEFAIDKTRDYLIAAGLNKQKEALDRLLKQEDLEGTYPSVGNIKMVDMPDGDLGGYTNFSDPDFNNPTYSGYNLKIWYGDGDTDNNMGWKGDTGITLSKEYLTNSNYKWYNLVETLVHELTHASAASYFTALPSYDACYGYYYISDSTLSELYHKGLLTTQEYNNFLNDKSARIQSMKLNYLVNCLWGECEAYKQSANYYDSIGADVLNKDDEATFLAVDEVDEKDTILNHIQKNYNSSDWREPEPYWSNFWTC